MSNIAENQDEVSLELEQRLQELREIFFSLDNLEPIIVAAKLRRWHNKTISTIETFFGTEEKDRFAIIGSLDSDSKDSIALLNERWDGYLTALLEEIYVTPNIILKTKQSVQLTAFPDSDKSKIRRWAWDNIGSHPMRVVITTSVFVVSITWMVAIETRVKPLEREIDFLRSDLSVAQDEKRFEFQVLQGSNSELKYLYKTPEQLWRDIEKMTSQQRQNFIESEYKGRWIRFKAPVYYVSQAKDNSYGMIDFDNEIVKVRVLMKQDQIPKLEGIFKGREVLIEAQFKLIEDNYIAFDRGRLLEL